MRYFIILASLIVTVSCTNPDRISQEGGANTNTEGPATTVVLDLELSNGN